MSASDRELAVLIDISRAANSAHACQLVEEFIAQHQTATLMAPTRTTTVDINAGGLLLSRAVLTRVNQVLRKSGYRLAAIFCTVPQTQQAALDEGFYVKGAWTGEAEHLAHEFLSGGMKSHYKPYGSLGEVAAEAGSTNVDLPMKSGFSMHLEPDERAIVSELEATTTPAAAPEAINQAPTRDAAELPPVPALDTIPQPVEMPSEPTTAEASAQAGLGLTADALEDDLSAIPMEDIVPANVTYDTLYIKQTLRSGQMIRYQGNVVLVGDAHAGSEISATGDITVWGEIRGIAHAGSEGNYRAEIRAMKIEALQLRISEYIARRPDRIYYHKPTGADLPAPELAKVADGEIKVFKDSVY